MLSGIYTGNPSSEVTFISNILGNILAAIYQGNTLDISIYGTILSISNLIILFGVIKITQMSENYIGNWVGVSILAMIFPVLLLSPTFTITAILLIATGILGIMLNSTQNQKNITNYLFFLGMLIFGILLRVEAFYGILLFLMPTIFTYIVLNNKNSFTKRNLFYFTIVIICIIITLFFQQTIISNLVKQDYNFMNYVRFQSVLNTYSPASLKLHQDIISGSAMRGIWSNIDFIILRNWAYADFSVFGYRNMKIGSEFVSDFSGIKGFLNADITETLKLIYVYLKDQLFFILGISLTASIVIFFNVKRKRSLVLLISLILSYLAGFYFLASVLRIPDRTSFPLFLAFAIFLIAISENRFKDRINPWIKFILSAFSIVFVTLFHLNSSFGLSKVISSNYDRIKFSEVRNFELQKFSNESIYIGPITYFPIANQGVFSKNTYWSSGDRTLPLSWATYSPNWYDMVEKLDLDASNIYNSLAKQENVYWVSNSYLAEILEMYMNDRQIYRGKLCSVAKLSGPDQAEIFTYQAKETDC